MPYLNRFIPVLMSLCPIQQVTAQETIIIHGNITVNGSPATKVAVMNNSRLHLPEARCTVLSDMFGSFTIEVSAGDTLVFHEKELEIVKKVVQHREIELKYTSVLMQKAVIELEEVQIKTSGLNAVSLGILQKPAKRYTPAESKLRTAGDFKPIHLLSLLGGTLEVDPIINAINGKTKRLKKEVKLEKLEARILFLKENYSDYITNTLQLVEEDVMKFIYFVAETTAVQKYIDTKDDSALRFFLGASVEAFKLASKQ